MQLKAPIIRCWETVQVWLRCCYLLNYFYFWIHIQCLQKCVCAILWFFDLWKQWMCARKENITRVKILCSRIDKLRPKNQCKWKCKEILRNTHKYDIKMGWRCVYGVLDVMKSKWIAFHTLFLLLLLWSFIKNSVKWEMMKHVVVLADIRWHLISYEKNNSRPNRWRFVQKCHFSLVCFRKTWLFSVFFVEFYFLRSNALGLFWVE